MRAFFLSLSIFLISTFYAHGQSSLQFTSDNASYRNGLELLSQGKYLGASKLFETYLSNGQDPVKLADSQYFIAFCALQLRNQDGEALIEKFIADHPNHTKAALAYYELGSLKYNEKNYKQAIRYFEKLSFAGLSPELQYEGKFKLGYSYFTQQQFEKAYEQFDALKREKNKYQDPSSYYAGFINFERGEYDRAFYDLTRAEKNAAYGPVIPSMLVKVYYKQKRYDELLDYGLNALNRKEVRDKEEINLYLGETYFQKEDYQNASKYYDVYLKAKRGKTDRELLFRIAYVQMKSAQLSEAISSFKQVALKSDTLGYIASYYLGNLYVQTENKNFALAAYKVAKDNTYDGELEEEALFQYAKLNLDLENYDEAINSINEYKSKYPGSERVENIDEILTDAYLNSKNYDKALKHIESLKYRSVRINRAYQQIAYFKGTELFNDAKFYEAVQMFDRSLQQSIINSFVIKANYWKAEAYSVGLKYKEAASAYEKVFQADRRRTSPEYLQSRYGIGYALFNLKDYEKALNHFEYYTSNSSLDDNKVKYRDALVRLGDCYYATKKYKQALSTFDKVIGMNRELADYSYLRKGVIYGIMDDLDAANQNFDIVLKNYPDSRHVPNALYQKAQFNFESGSYKYAVEYFTRLIERYPESNYVPYGLQSRAIASTNLGNQRAAERDYKAILDMYPTHEVANNAVLGLQEILLSSGKSEDFDGYLARYKEANPQSTQLESIEFEAAKSQYFNQQYEGAIASLERFIQTYPNSARMVEARYLLADTHNRQGQTELALENYYQISKEISFNRYNRVIQRIAELEAAQGDQEKSIEYFEQLAKIAATKKEEVAAWNGLMKGNYSIGNYSKSITYGQQILEKGLVTLNAKNEALLLMGKASLAVGDKSKGRDYLEQTVESAKDENGAEALFLIAQLLFESELHQESIDRLFQLNANFSMYEYWLGKSFLLIADNYLAIDEDFQAKATLESIVEHSPIEEIVDDAELRLKALEDKAAVPEEVGLDTLEVEDIENR